MNSSEYRKQKQDEFIRTVQDAYLLGYLAGKELVPRIDLMTDPKTIRSILAKAMADALRATAP